MFELNLGLYKSELNLLLELNTKWLFQPPIIHAVDDDRYGYARVRIEEMKGEKSNKLFDVEDIMPDLLSPKKGVGSVKVSLDRGEIYVKKPWKYTHEMKVSLDKDLKKDIELFGDTIDEILLKKEKWKDAQGRKRKIARFEAVSGDIESFLRFGGFPDEIISLKCSKNLYLSSNKKKGLEFPLEKELPNVSVTLSPEACNYLKNSFIGESVEIIIVEELNFTVKSKNALVMVGAME